MNINKLIELCDDILSDSSDCVEIKIKCYDQGYANDNQASITSYTGEENSIYDNELIIEIAKLIKKRLTR